MRSHPVTAIPEDEMANFMLDWLKDKIGGELKLAIEWKKNVDNGIASNGSKLNLQALAKIYEDDSSNLRVKIEETRLESRVVQVVEVLMSTKPITAVVADGYTSIYAKFKGAAVDAYNRDYGERFPTGKRGCVMNLVKFEIVATPLGVENRRISLLIEEFNVLGSSGSPTFGHPKPIETSKDVITLIKELLSLNSDRSAKETDSRNNGHTVDREAETSLSEATPAIDTGQDSTLMTQAPLASQFLPPRRQVRSPEPEVLNGVNLAPPVGARRSISANLKGQFVLPEQRTREEQLLSLLLPKDSHVAHIRSDKQSTATRFAEIARDGARMEDLNTSVAARDEDPSVPEDRCAESESDNLGAVGAPIEDAVSSRCESPDSSRAASNDRGEHAVGGLEAMPEAAIVDSAENITPVANTARQTASPAREVASEPIWQTDPEGMVQDVWQNIRITRRICQIPSEQKTILEKPESWLPSHPGKKFPSPNIPIRVLKQLNKAAERRKTPVEDRAVNNEAGVKVSSEAYSGDRPARGYDVVGGESESESGSETGSAAASDSLPLIDVEEPMSSIPIPKEDWPSSPQEQLPPDSSVPGAEPDEEHVDGGEAEVSDAEAEDMPGPLDLEKLEVPLAGRSEEQLRLPVSLEGAGSQSSSRKLGAVTTSSQNGHKHRGEEIQHPARLIQPPTQTEEDQGSPADSGNSDLEVSIPHALNQQDVIPRLGLSPTQRLSTVLQQASKLQVKETPYQSARRVGNFSKVPSSAPVIPSTFSTPSRNRHRILSQGVRLDGTDEVVENRDDEATADLQIRVEMNALHEHRSAKLVDNMPTARTISHQESSPALLQNPREGAQSRPTSLNVADQVSVTNPHPNTKRENDSRAMPQQALKRRKTSQPNLGFSQEIPVSQDPAVKARNTRREFIRKFSRSEQLESSLGSHHEQAVTLGNEAPHPSSDNIEMFDAVESQSDPPTDTKGSTRELPDPEKSTSGDPPTTTEAQSIPPAKNLADVSPTEPISVYARFSAAYPEYGGNVKHFLGLCRMIDRLQKAEKMQHRSLWDDFIIRHRTNYQEYLLRCSSEGDDPVAYEKFYRDEIDEPMHSKRIMSPASLKLALEQGTATAPPAATEPPAVRQSPAASTTSSNYGVPQPAFTASTEARQPTPKRPIHTSPPDEPAAKRPPPPHKPHPEPFRPMLDSYRPTYTDHEPRHRKETRRPRAASPPPTSSTAPPSGSARRQIIDLTLTSNDASSPLTSTLPSLTSTLPPHRAAAPASRGGWARRSLPWKGADGAERAESNGGSSLRATADAAPDNDQTRQSRVTAADKEESAGAREKQEERVHGDQDGDWWKDPRTPFKEFACAYAGLKSVGGSMGMVGDEGLSPPVRRVDVLRWAL